MLQEKTTFRPGLWTDVIDVRDFIQRNYTPYEGDESFLAEASTRTKRVFAKVEELLALENKLGVLAIDNTAVAGIDAFGPGYIDRENEVIVGLQTDSPLKRILNPFGGIRMVQTSIKAYELDVDEHLLAPFPKLRKTHNDGVFDAYNDAIRRARSAGLITGLPDAYGRGRIIGDYRRLPLYGIDRLVEDKQAFLEAMPFPFGDEEIRIREETASQIRALAQIKRLGESYGFDLSAPATNAREAVQFLYFAYLAGVKENNGAAMSLGRVSGFLDIYIERDLADGKLSELEAQELIDQFVIKLRIVRHLRTPEYDELFAGDPNWVTESLGGMGTDGRTLVTKTTYRFLHTLTNLSAAPEPNMTVLWAEALPLNFKRYCAKLSIETSSIQYENDDLMRPMHGDDYGIACCISAMVLGKEMQFFGARCNLAKALLYAINGGVDEISGKQVIDGIDPITADVLDHDAVYENFKRVLERLAELYVNTMNIIHYMHDKYAYEAGQMAFHDSVVGRYMAFGVAGLSIVIDSFSAMRHTEVRVLRENGIAVDFLLAGDYPPYGNDIDEIDSFGNEVLEFFMDELRKHRTYRGAKHTLSVLTITSNVVYGKKTGSTPDGREKGTPFAPGANPMHGRDKNGALASLNSVAKLKYEGVAEDGISNTFTIVPEAIGREDEERLVNLVRILDGYFGQRGFHLNVNVLNREMLIDASENPDKYPNLTIRVSGYAVRFNKLSKAQQMDVINRTFHRMV